MQGYTEVILEGEEGNDVDYNDDLGNNDPMATVKNSDL